MSSKGKTITIVVCCVLAVVIVALVLWYLKKKKEEEKDTEKGASENTAVNTLKAGSRGEEVKRLQAYLNMQIAEHNRNSEVQIVPLEVDGIFGPNYSVTINDFAKIDTNMSDTEITAEITDSNKLKVIGIPATTALVNSLF